MRTTLFSWLLHRALLLINESILNYLNMLIVTETKHIIDFLLLEAHTYQQVQCPISIATALQSSKLYQQQNFPLMLYQVKF